MTCVVKQPSEVLEILSLVFRPYTRVKLQVLLDCENYGRLLLVARLPKKIFFFLLHSFGLILALLKLDLVFSCHEVCSV